MMRSSILGASTMLNVLIQHLLLHSLFGTKIWIAFRASNPSKPCSKAERAHRVQGGADMWQGPRESTQMPGWGHVAGGLASEGPTFSGPW